MPVDRLEMIQPRNQPVELGARLHLFCALFEFRNLRRKGGAVDTVLPEVTGLLFAEQTKESLMAAVERLEAWLPDFRPADATRRAQLFSPERFDAGVMAVINDALGGAAGPARSPATPRQTSDAGA